MLKKDVGVWNAKGKMWMPGVPEPIEFEGVETNEMLGELFVITDFRGDFGGMAFRGHGRVGFNPTTKKYESTWFDVTNPYGMTAESTSGPSFGFAGSEIHCRIVVCADHGGHWLVHAANDQRDVCFIG